MLEKTKRILECLEIKVNYIGSDYVAASTEYRQGNTSTGLLCRDSHVFDVVTQARMEWPEFISRVKRIKLEDAKKWLAGAEIQSGEEEFEEKVDKIEQPKYLNEEDYSNTVKSYKFFLDRGISEETLTYYGAALSQGGALYGRILFKIRDEKGKLVGVAGRDALNRIEKYADFPKWLNKGMKSKWVYPAFPKNIEAIKKTGQIVIVESVGDMLKLSDCGIHQLLCNFGLSLSPSRLSHCIRFNPSKLFVSLNEDSGPEKKENWGQKAAGKVSKKLSGFFSSEKIVNAPPIDSRGDFGEMSNEEVGIWAEKYGVLKHE